jgi:PHP family Zn ribbon phosphoesterase
MQWFSADLHIHTCLSPCSDLKMSPQKIIAEVRRQGIDIIAICDHNSAENVPAVMKAADGSGVVVFPGMEVCTKEEIHVLALFDNAESTFTMQSFVYEQLHGENDADVFGMQVVANEVDEVEEFNDKLLIGATDVPLVAVVDKIHALHGLAIASHIDRESFSVISQLGFIPESVRFDALEVSANTGDDEAATRFSEYQQQPFVRNSDAHSLDQIGTQTTQYWMDEPTLGEIKRALMKASGRFIVAHIRHR